MGGPVGAKETCQVGADQVLQGVPSRGDGGGEHRAPDALGHHVAVNILAPQYVAEGGEHAAALLAAVVVVVVVGALHLLFRRRGGGGGGGRRGWLGRS